MSNLESTVCLFNSSKADCRAPKRTNLNMLICQKHLKDYFGLEMGFHQDDHPTNIAWVGGFLRPVKNISYFKRNTVIFPTKKFFDQTLRPEEYKNRDANFRKYQMNPIIIEYIRKYGMTSGKSVEPRLVLEIYRNLMDDKVDPGPGLSTHIANLSTLVRSKKTISESLIQDQSVFNIFDQIAIFYKDKFVPITDLNISKCMQYILVNLLYSEMKITYEQEYFSDYLQYNCEFVEDVGIVATELINHPHYLVINGSCTGSSIFYNSFVSLVQKEVVHKNYTLKDIPSQYALPNALKSGSVC